MAKKEEKKMAKKEELTQNFFNQAVNARKEFDTFDNEVNNSVKKVMAAYATLAEKKPEELFGLKPSERDKFFVNQLLDSNVLRAATSGSATNEEPSGNDITGSNPLSIAAIADAIAKVASSEGGAKIVEEMLNHIRAEKDFIKETGKEVIGWLTGD